MLFYILIIDIKSHEKLITDNELILFTIVAVYVKLHMTYSFEPRLLSLIL